MYNPETLESLLAYPGRHSRPLSTSSSYPGTRRSGMRVLLRKVRKTA